MKILIIIFLFLMSQIATAQTVIPSTTTVYSFSGMKNGVYRVITLVDTLDITKDTALKIHDTIKIIVPCPKVDTAAIQALKICPVCPPPIICPVCPPIPKQRTVNSLSWDRINKAWLIGYDDGTFSTL